MKEPLPAFENRSIFFFACSGLHGDARCYKGLNSSANRPRIEFFFGQQGANVSIERSFPGVIDKKVSEMRLK